MKLFEHILFGINLTDNGIKYTRNLSLFVYFHMRNMNFS